MGNCLQHESSMHWGGDDWSSPKTDRFLAADAKRDMLHDPNMFKIDAMEAEEAEEEGEEVLLHKKVRGITNTTTTTKTKSTEVKIKITKKQLEEFLERVENIKELSVQQVLAQLVNVSEKFDANQQSWRPNLQSIPE